MEGGALIAEVRSADWEPASEQAVGAGEVEGHDALALGEDEDMRPADLPAQDVANAAVEAAREAPDEDAPMEVGSSDAHRCGHPVSGDGERRLAGLPSARDLEDAGRARQDGDVRRRVRGRSA